MKTNKKQRYDIILLALRHYVEEQTRILFLDDGISDEDYNEIAKKHNLALSTLFHYEKLLGEEFVNRGGLNYLKLMEIGRNENKNN